MVFLFGGEGLKRAEVLEKTEIILKKSGFQVSARCSTRSSCFDFAAKRGKQMAFIKALVNLGNISGEEALELKGISEFFSAMPLFIGDEARKKPLDDDTLYVRYDIYAMTPKTFGNMLFLKMYPLVEAGPGGYYVDLSGEAIRSKRQELGLSVGKLAEMMGVSRRTVYGYERGMAKASVSAAYSLEWILGIPVAQPIDPFQKSPQASGFLAATKRMIVRNRLLQTVMKKLAYFNFKVSPIKRAPFDFIAQCPKEQRNIVGGVTCRKERNVDQRTEEILSVSKIVGAHSVFITDGKQAPNNSISTVNCEELRRMNCAEDLMAHF